MGAVIVDIDRTMVDDVLNARVALVRALLDGGYTNRQAVDIAEMACRLMKRHEFVSRRPVGDVASWQQQWPMSQIIGNPWEGLTASIESLREVDEELRIKGISREAITTSYQRLRACREVVLGDAMAACGVRRLPPPELHRILDAAVENRNDPDAQELMPGAGELLREMFLSGVPVFALTNGWKPAQMVKCQLIQRIMEQRYGILFRFAEIGVSSHARFDNYTIFQELNAVDSWQADMILGRLHPPKPSPAAFSDLLIGARLPGDQVVMVGDSLGSDLIGGLTSDLKLGVDDEGRVVGRQQARDVGTYLRIHSVLYDTAEEQQDEHQLRSSLVGSMRTIYKSEVAHMLASLEQDGVRRDVGEDQWRAWLSDLDDERAYVHDLLDDVVDDRARWSVVRDLREVLDVLPEWSPVPEPVPDDVKERCLLPPSYQRRPVRPRRSKEGEVRAERFLVAAGAVRSDKVVDALKRKRQEVSEIATERQTAPAAPLHRGRLARLLHDAGLPVPRFLMMVRDDVMVQHRAHRRLSTVPNLSDDDRGWVIDQIFDMVVGQMALNPYDLERPQRALPHRYVGTRSFGEWESRETFVRRVRRCADAVAGERAIVGLLQSVGLSSQIRERFESTAAHIGARRLAIVQDRLDKDHVRFVPGYDRTKNPRLPLVAPRLEFEVSDRSHIGDPLEQVATMLLQWPELRADRHRFVQKLVRERPDLGTIEHVQRDLDHLADLRAVEQVVEESSRFLRGDTLGSSRLMAVIDEATAHFGLDAIPSRMVSEWARQSLPLALARAVGPGVEHTA